MGDESRCARPSAKRGRPPTHASYGPTTRDQILDAARSQFSAVGYDGASIRSIAKAAHTDPALVHYYFGTKGKIFSAMAEQLVAFDVFEALSGTAAEIGDLLAHLTFELSENPGTGEALLAVVRSALTHDDAAAVLRELICRRMVRVAAVLGVPEPELAAQLVAAEVIGIVMLRYVVPMEPIATIDVNEVVKMVAQTFRLHLAGS
jgi:AcrR family transcriptional regulator